MLKIYERTIRRIVFAEIKGELHGTLDQSKEDIEDYLVSLLEKETYKSNTSIKYD